LLFKNKRERKANEKTIKSALKKIPSEVQIRGSNDSGKY